MPDTGAPWNIPYVESTDLVSDWPADSLALANAIDSGLDAAGGLVAVKHALFTGTQSASLAPATNFAVTDLSITHTLSSASNKLIISAYIGSAASSEVGARVAMAVADNGTLIAIGDAAGDRVRSTVSGFNNNNAGRIVSHAATFIYEPGDTASHTFTVRAISQRNVTQTVYVNRSDDDTDNETRARSSSGLVIQEVKV